LRYFAFIRKSPCGPRFYGLYAMRCNDGQWCSSNGIRTANALETRLDLSMPRVKMTQAAADKIRPPTDKINETHWDTQCPGFGLRISSKNRRTWIAMYRVGGKAVMETLGTMWLIPKVDVARNLARESMVKARAGTNPVEEKREEEAAAAAAAEAQKKTFAWLIEHQDGDVTKGFLPQYARRKQRASTLYQTQRMLNRVMPVLGPKLLTEIKKSDITELLDHVAAKRARKRKDLKHGPDAEARTIQQCLSTVFKWAVGEDYIEHNPVSSISKTRYGKNKARDRYLSVEEIKAFWAACDQLGWPFGPIGKLLLLTGQRAGEVAGMRRSELHEAGRWTLPEHRTKNGKRHLVFLSPQAQEIIDGLPHLDGDLVFSISGKVPVSAFGVAKQMADKFMAEMLAQQGRTLLPWVWHDLRRTVVTGMSENGVAPHIVEATVNHISGARGGIAGVYNHASYASDRRAALESWGRYIDGVIGRGGDDNVVVLRAS
jgi:integrase